MLEELETLLRACSPGEGIAELRRLVVDENVLGKRTATTREHTVRKLKALYGLESSVPVFDAMHRIWIEEPAGHPMLAMLCAIARDPLLRVSAGVVLDTPWGAEVTRQQLASTVRPSFSESTREAIVSHLASSWTQAGFLEGTTRKLRVQAQATPGVAAYALALGFMEGARGSLLLSTSWMRLLDCSSNDALELVQGAARWGWVEYRAAGDVIDIRVEKLVSGAAREWCDGE